jgi:hypothetical protein
MTADDSHKSIRVIDVSEKDEDKNKCSKRFLAMVLSRGYVDVLLPSTTKLTKDTIQNTPAYVMFACR